MRTRTFSQLVLTLPFALSFAASAHETWITVSKVENGRFTAELATGSRFPTSDSAVKPERIEQTFVRLGSASVGSVMNLREDGAVTRFEGQARGHGIATLAIAIAPKAITIPAKEFEAYLREIGARDALKERKRRGESKKPGREVYRKLPKTFVVLGAGVAPTPPIGLPLEMAVEQDPSRLLAGDTLYVTLLHQGKGAAKQLVGVLGEDGRTSFTGHTDDNGQIAIPLAKAGRSLLTTTLVRRLANGEKAKGTPYEDADWESLWASLLLEVKPR